MDSNFASISEREFHLDFFIVVKSEMEKIATAELVG